MALRAQKALPACLSVGHDLRGTTFYVCSNSCPLAGDAQHFLLLEACLGAVCQTGRGRGFRQSSLSYAVQGHILKWKAFKVPWRARQ